MPFLLRKCLKFRKRKKEKKAENIVKTFNDITTQVTYSELLHERETLNPSIRIDTEQDGVSHNAHTINPDAPVTNETGNGNEIDTSTNARSNNTDENDEALDGTEAEITQRGTSSQSSNSEENGNDASNDDDIDCTQNFDRTFNCCGTNSLSICEDDINRINVYSDVFSMMERMKELQCRATQRQETIEEKHSDVGDYTKVEKMYAPDIPMPDSHEKSTNFTEIIIINPVDGINTSAVKHVELHFSSEEEHELESGTYKNSPPNNSPPNTLEEKKANSVKDGNTESREQPSDETPVMEVFKPTKNKDKIIIKNYSAEPGVRAASSNITVQNDAFSSDEANTLIEDCTRARLSPWNQTEQIAHASKSISLYDLRENDRQKPKGTEYYEGSENTYSDRGLSDILQNIEYISGDFTDVTVFTDSHEKIDSSDCEINAGENVLQSYKHMCDCLVQGDYDFIRGLLLSNQPMTDTERDICPHGNPLCIRKASSVLLHRNQNIIEELDSLNGEQNVQISTKASDMEENFETENSENGHTEKNISNDKQNIHSHPTVRDTGENIENENIENNSPENEKTEKESVENESIENENIENECIENECIENESIENGNIENKRIENESIGSGNIENESTENECLENESIENGNIENKRIENESIGSGNIEIESTENECLENESIENGNIENKRIVNEIIDNGNIENEKVGNKNTVNENIENGIIENEYYGNENIENGNIENESIKSRNIQNTDIGNKSTEHESIENQNIENGIIENESIENENTEKETKKPDSEYQCSAHIWNIPLERTINKRDFNHETSSVNNLNYLIPDVQKGSFTVNDIKRDVLEDDLYEERDKNLKENLIFFNETNCSTLNNENKTNDEEGTRQSSSENATLLTNMDCDFMQEAPLNSIWDEEHGRMYNRGLEKSSGNPIFNLRNLECDMETDSMIWKTDADKYKDISNNECGISKSENDIYHNIKKNLIKNVLSDNMNHDVSYESKTERCIICLKDTDDKCNQSLPNVNSSNEERRNLKSKTIDYPEFEIQPDIQKIPRSYSSVDDKHEHTQEYYLQSNENDHFIFPDSNASDNNYCFIQSAADSIDKKYTFLPQTYISDTDDEGQCYQEIERCAKTQSLIEKKSDESNSDFSEDVAVKTFNKTPERMSLPGLMHVSGDLKKSNETYTSKMNNENCQDKYKYPHFSNDFLEMHNTTYQGYTAGVNERRQDLQRNVNYESVLYPEITQVPYKDNQSRSGIFIESLNDEIIDFKNLTDSHEGMYDKSETVLNKKIQKDHKILRRYSVSSLSESSGSSKLSINSGRKDPRRKVNKSDSFIMSAYGDISDIDEKLTENCGFERNQRRRFRERAKSKYFRANVDITRKRSPNHTKDCKLSINITHKNDISSKRMKNWSLSGDHLPEYRKPRVKLITRREGLNNQHVLDDMKKFGDSINNLDDLLRKLECTDTKFETDGLKEVKEEKRPSLESSKREPQVNTEMQSNARVIPIEKSGSFEFKFSSFENDNRNRRDPLVKDSMGKTYDEVANALENTLPFSFNRQSGIKKEAGGRKDEDNRNLDIEENVEYQTTSTDSDSSSDTCVDMTPARKRILSTSRAIRSPKYSYIINGKSSEKNAFYRTEPYIIAKGNLIAYVKKDEKNNIYQIKKGFRVYNPDSKKYKYKYLASEKVNYDTKESAKCPNYYNNRATSPVELKTKFDDKFKRYAGRGRSNGELISYKRSTEWLKDAGVVGKSLTAEEANHAFKSAAGVKVALNKGDYRHFLKKLSRIKRMNYNDIYGRLCAASYNKCIA